MANGQGKKSKKGTIDDPIVVSAKLSDGSTLDFTKAETDSLNEGLYEGQSLERFQRDKGVYADDLGMYQDKVKVGFEGKNYEFDQAQIDSLYDGEYGPEDLKRLEVKDEDEDQHDKARRKVAGMLKESFRDMFWLKSVDERLDIIKVFRSLGGNKENEQ